MVKRHPLGIPGHCAHPVTTLQRQPGRFKANAGGATDNQDSLGGGRRIAQLQRWHTRGERRLALPATCQGQHQRQKRSDLFYHACDYSTPLWFDRLSADLFKEERMEFWLAWFHENNRGHDVTTIAREAEALGYTGVALSDHVALPKHQQSRHPLRGIPYDPEIPNIEPMTTAAAMSAVTSKLRFMTYAYVMGMRDPFTVAKQAAALSDLSDGRFALGMTPGWNTDEIALLGHDPSTRGKRFVESIEVIKGLWHNDLFSFSGEHYAFEDVGIAPRPAVPPDIYIGGNSPLAIKRAAANAGWIGMNHSVEELKPLIGTLDELSGGKANSYVIAAEQLTDAYVQALEALNVTGIVLMPWVTEAPPDGGLDIKLEAMRKNRGQTTFF
jgi:probable F420-dependent oxidoreductase